MGDELLRPEGRDDAVEIPPEVLAAACRRRGATQKRRHVSFCVRRRRTWSGSPGRRTNARPNERLPTACSRRCRAEGHGGRGGSGRTRALSELPGWMRLVAPGAGARRRRAEEAVQAPLARARARAPVGDAGRVRARLDRRGRCLARTPSRSGGRGRGSCSRPDPRGRRSTPAVVEARAARGRGAWWRCPRAAGRRHQSPGEGNEMLPAPHAAAHAGGVRYGGRAAAARDGPVVLLVSAGPERPPPAAEVRERLALETAGRR